MDTTALTTAGISTSGVAIIFILYKVVKAIVNKKIVSSCCGQKMEMGVAVSDMKAESPVATAV